MSNNIATRIYDFLKNYQPFNLLEREVLLQVSASVVVKYYEPGQVLFRQDGEPGAYFFVMREGAVHLFKEENGVEILVDECCEGDMFGMRPLLAGQTYAFTGKAEEESLVYAIPIAVFAPILKENPKVTWYLAKHLAVDAGRSFANLHKGHLFLEQDKYLDGQFKLVEIQSLETSKKPVTCPPDMSIREAAIVMTEHRVSSIIVVDNEERPLGIVTDRDIRSKVVTGKLDASQPVSALMFSPVATVGTQVTVADVQIEMVRSRTHHLCVTEDGTTQSKVLGVLSEHDLLVIQGNNPAILVREILRSETSTELRRIRERTERLLEQYIYQEVSISYICNIMSEVNDTLVRRAIDLSVEALTEAGQARPDVLFAWLTLGSGGRKEQLLRTDQDSALVFADVPDEDLEKTQQYFLALAERVTKVLFEVGFDYCSGKMMASNPLWCKSLSDWKQQFADWMLTPDPQHVRYCTIFIDYRPVYGEEALADLLTQHIFGVLDHNPGFLSFMAKSAVANPPPLSFFRNFVVEQSGEYKDNFDIKKRAMLPLADAARVLILEAKVGKINNTFQRFERLAELEEQNRELFESAAEAYEILIRYRTLQGLKNKNSGRYFKPEELSKMERLNLKNTFRPIGDLLTVLTVRFQLAYLR
ncbi:MAG: CBS domain-containing protein [Saprospiraceae bacterium]|nr:CBS domain-containing protein [Saprospiraceae bacterium]